LTLYLLSSLVCPTVGLSYATEPLSVREARALVRRLGFQSRIGHAATAAIASELLGVRVEVNRTPAPMVQGDLAICIALRGRLVAEGDVLSREQMEAVGYDLVLMRASSALAEVSVPPHALAAVAGVAGLASYGLFRLMTLWREHRELSAVGYLNGRELPLTVVTIDGKPVEVRTARAFRSMRKAAAADGVALRITSGFRTMDEQRRLYRCYIEGNCNDGNLAAKPGYSSHQSGLALDLNSKGKGVLAWLRRRAHAFRFSETIDTEPWHWEYTDG